MTVRELNQRAQIHGEQEEAEWKRTAWLAANVINLFSKEPVSVTDLLHPPHRMTDDEREEAFKELWRRHEDAR